MHLETQAVHPETPFPATSRPVAVPIYQSSTFAFDDPGECAAALKRPDRGYAYSRHSNPTTRALENAVTAMEGGAAGLATSSGMGAISTVFLALLRAGDHVIAQSRLYGGTYSVLSGLAARFGVEVSFISGTDRAELAAAIRPESRILYLETIANPTTEVADLPGLLDEAGRAGLTRVVDNTFATPVLCRPLAYGADIVVHSATKYLGGHDDVIAGLAIFADQTVHARVWQSAVDLGVTADPFACWLVLRGLKTLPLRLARHCENAEKLASLLDGHPRVTQVRWPGLPGDPSHRRATEILDGYGGILAFDLAGGVAAGREFISRLTCAALATSLGGPQTLVLHPASTSHRELDAGALRAAGITEGTIRVSAGLEHHEDLAADFEQALKL